MPDFAADRYYEEEVDDHHSKLKVTKTSNPNH